MGGKRWTPTEIERVHSLRKAGLSYAEIGNAIDRNGCAVKDFMSRNQPISSQQRSAGRAIGLTDEDIRLRESAVVGSARLLAEIERVFGA